MTAAVAVVALAVETPRAWRERMLLRYPNGGLAHFDPRGRFVRPGDVVNEHMVDRLEVDGEHVVAVLRPR